jgi:segregation and condensation protein B
MALSQTPGEEITPPVAEADVSSDPVVSDPTLTPLDIPTDGSTALPIGDDDGYEDDAYEDEDEDSDDDDEEEGDDDEEEGDDD